MSIFIALYVVSLIKLIFVEHYARFDASLHKSLVGIFL